MNKAVISVVGKDSVGIIAGVCNYLAKENINILDISQTIVKEYFNMMMIVDVTNIKQNFTDIAHELEVIGVEIGVNIKCQRSEIFDSMHRL